MCIGMRIEHVHTYFQTGREGSSIGGDDNVCLSQKANQGSHLFHAPAGPSHRFYRRSIEQRLQYVRSLFACGPFIAFFRPPYVFASRSVSCARVCSHVLTRETGSKGQTGSKPPLEVVWLNANRMRIGSECAFRVDAPMRIEAN